MKRTFEDIVDDIIHEDTRYSRDAYEFTMEALNYTQKRFKRDKHVSGNELLKGIRDLLIQRFGPMTLTVLDYWGIKKTDDFGNIVFNLVKFKVLSKTEDDHIEHFRNGYDFIEVFDKGYRQKLAKKISRMR